MSRVDRLIALHADRDAARVAIKFASMRENAFAFFRGTNNLFQEDWTAHVSNGSLDSAPLAWQCGDLHAENFGTFRGGNRLVYFDLNDFDDARLDVVPHDISRLATSVAVAAALYESAAESSSDIPELVALTVNAYAMALRGGKAWWVAPQTAKGLIRDLLVSLQSRSDLEFYESRCKLGRKPRLRIDGKRTLAATDGERERITALLREGLRDHSPTLIVHDVARRIAGNSSLGLPRWVALAEHALESERWALLDLKSPAPSLSRSYQSWESEAERVVTVQRLMQAAPPALLRVLSDSDGSLVVRELMPSDDRVRLSDAFRKPRGTRRLFHTMGELLAWGQLRAAGRRGAANGDALVEWAHTDDWIAPTIAFAQTTAIEVRADWKAFCRQTG